MNKILSHRLVFCIVLLLYPAWPASGGTDTADNISFSPIYRVPLRVHLGNSQRPPQEWIPILEEINYIWMSQAGICFQMHTVDHDEELENGIDLWFDKHIPDWNGYFTDPHDIHVRDNPDLRPAENPASSSAARTAAHELGHAFRLGHRQNSDDNLMRSKTYGWQLHDDEITLAREAVQEFAVTSSSSPCNPPLIHTEP